MKNTVYQNPRTKKNWPVTSPLWCAPDDGKYLNLNLGSGLKFKDIHTATRSLWRYHKALRIDESLIISLGEGWTPLVEDRWDDLPVIFKLDYLNPSGSFKDRGISVLLTYLKQHDIKTILEDSSGNAGASIASYAARGALNCTIVAPASAPQSKLVQIAAMGATLQLVEGSRDDVAQKALQLAQNIFYASHSWHPYFLEGTKTVAFELWEQLDGEAPDCVIAPLGQGGNILGCYIGFCELLSAGSIKKIPRLYGVQALNCAAFHWAFSQTQFSGKTNKTIADGIASAKPVRLNEVLEALSNTNGKTLAVSESEIATALKKIHSKGFYVEPTSAAALAGLSQLIANKEISADERVVVLLTGSGLKATEVIDTLL